MDARKIYASASIARKTRCVSRKPKFKEFTNSSI